MSNTSPEAALSKLLEGATDVTDLRGNRISPGQAPLNEPLPFQVYNRIIRTQHHGINLHSGLASARVQIDNYSDDKIEVDDLAEKTRVFLEVQSGVVTVGANTITINHIKLDEDDATSQPLDDGSDTILQRIRQEFIVEHNVTIPV